jgi:transposase
MTLLSVCDTKEQANYQEKLWILLYDSLDPDVGYNMTEGGDGGGVFTGRKHKPESIEKMKKSATGRSPSKETREKISKFRKGMVGEKSPVFKRSISTKEIVRLYKEGKTTRQIAKMFGVEKTLVIGRLEGVGIPLRLSPRDARKARLIAEGKEQFLEIDDKELARLYNSGYTMEEIAPKFELTRIAVRNRLIKEGVTLRRGGKRLKEEWPKLPI